MGKNENNKSFWISVAILILVITVSFGLGYIVAKQVNPTPIIIEQ